MSERLPDAFREPLVCITAGMWIRYDCKPSVPVSGTVLAVDYTGFTSNMEMLDLLEAFRKGEDFGEVTDQVE